MSSNLSPGFRFHPTDEELVGFYLKRRVTGRLFHGDPIGIVDVYKYEPWDLPCLSKMKTRDLEWYFYSGLDKKYGKGSSRTNRATEKGYWKTTGKDRPVNHANRTVGMKKTLVYHFGRAPTGARTNWVMHEYRSVDEVLAQSGVAQDAYVLCRIFEKSGAGPKNGEKYGAPLIEEEWDNFDMISPLAAFGDEYINEVPDVDGLLETKDLDQDQDQKHVAPLAPLAVVDDKLMNGVLDDGDFMETNDLDKKLDMPAVAIGSADFPSNFHYGECSSLPEYSQAFISDRKLLEDTMGNSGPENHQPFNMAQQYGADTNAGNDGGDTGELSYDEKPLNFDCLDSLAQGLNPNWSPLNLDEILETDDLANLAEGNPAEADSSVIGMVDEYLSYTEDDIYKYICFDSPGNEGSEIAIPDQGPQPIQQNVEVETRDISVASKPVFEAQSSNEASLKQHVHQTSKFVSEDSNPIVKHAHKLLASMPAPPAFASEFPTKGFALGLHPGAQSSNTTHIAGMISITDITLRGNAMDWMVGKNGGFNATIMSSGFSQSDFNSDSLMPISDLVSSKTTCVLSHGCLYLMGFSVLILSLSFKIGSYMYTAK